MQEIFAHSSHPFPRVYSHLSGTVAVPPSCDAYTPIDLNPKRYTHISHVRKRHSPGFTRYRETELEKHAFSYLYSLRNDVLSLSPRTKHSPHSKVGMYHENCVSDFRAESSTSTPWHCRVDVCVVQANSLRNHPQCLRVCTYLSVYMCVCAYVVTNQKSACTFRSTETHTCTHTERQACVQAGTADIYTRAHLHTTIHKSSIRSPLALLVCIAWHRQSQPASQASSSSSRRGGGALGRLSLSLSRSCQRRAAAVVYSYPRARSETRLFC